MLRSRSTFAVIFSIVLIFGAVWVRYANAKDALAERDNQILLDTKNDPYSNLNTREGFNQALGKTSTTTPTNLTSTDLIGRQMFSDYMSLVSRGQATDENITKLANTYAQGMLKVNQGQSTKITDEELKITGDTQTAFQIYATQTANILNKYSSLFRKNLNQVGISGEVAPENLSKFGTVLYPIYQQLAEELIKISVPLSLKETHLNLVNSYLESAYNLETLKKLNSDPVTALAAFNTQITNFETEMTLINNIKVFLGSKGVVFNFSS
jgi:hypothetical protein